MTGYFLICVIGLISLLKNDSESRPFLLFSTLCGVMILFDLLITEELYPFYYLTSAIFDLLIMIVITKLDHTKKSTLTLQKICIAFIITNFIGWIMYELYIRPVIYNYTCEVLYSLVLFTLIRTSKENGFFDNSNIFNNKFFYLFDNQSVKLLQNIKKKKRVERLL